MTEPDDVQKGILALLERLPPWPRVVVIAIIVISGTGACTAAINQMGEAWRERQDQNGEATADIRRFQLTQTADWQHVYWTQTAEARPTTPQPATTTPTPTRPPTQTPTLTPSPTSTRTPDLGVISAIHESERGTVPLCPVASPILEDMLPCWYPIVKSSTFEQIAIQVYGNASLATSLANHNRDSGGYYLLPFKSAVGAIYIPRRSKLRAPLYPECDTDPAEFAPPCLYTVGKTDHSYSQIAAAFHKDAKLASLLADANKYYNPSKATWYTVELEAGIHLVIPARR